MNHGGRRTFHKVAYATFESTGSKERSMAPRSSLLKRTFCHVAPPSRERYTPRSGFDMYALPNAATKTIFGFFGSTMIRPICFVFSRPRCFHVLPASVDL